jgi:hypothetical protein
VERSLAAEKVSPVEPLCRCKTEKEGVLCGASVEPLWDAGKVSSVEHGKVSSVEHGKVSSVEHGKVSSVEHGKVSSVEH